MSIDVNKGVERRTVLKGAAWSVPVIAVAAATPFAGAAVSGNQTVNGFQVNGTCGLLGALGPGFTVTAGTEDLPAGTQIVIDSSSLITNVNVLGLGANASLAQISLLTGDNAAVTLTSPLPAGQTLQIRWLLSVALDVTTTAALTLPTGYVAGTGTKPSGELDQLLIVGCSAS